MSFVNALILSWLAACALCDWRTRRIPNWLTFSGLLVATLNLALTQTTLTGGTVLAGLGGLAMAALLTLPGFILGRLGAGDVKLLAGLGLATSAGSVLVTFVAAALCLPLAALVRRALPAAVSVDHEWPFGPALLAGYVFSLVIPFELLQ